MTIIDMTGQRFGRLVVIGPGTRSGQRKRFRWRCQCDCGRTTNTTRDDLIAGKASSCGCNREGNTKHGMSCTRTHISWKAMRQRCLNSKASHFEYYGGRKIKICKRWDHFKNFFADMGERPIGKTLDRYPNPNGDYKPSNCRWATPHEQRLNRNRSKHV